MIDSKGYLPGCFGAAVIEMAALEKEKREQAPALQTELSTRVSIVWDREKSRKTFGSGPLTIYPTIGPSGAVSADAAGIFATYPRKAL
jgi:hypothetical protein